MCVAGCAGAEGGDFERHCGGGEDVAGRRKRRIARPVGVEVRRRQMRGNSGERRWRIGWLAGGRVRFCGKVQTGEVRSRDRVRSCASTRQLATTGCVTRVIPSPSIYKSGSFVCKDLLWMVG